MLNGVTGFDHCMILVRDLAQAATRYRDLGFTLTDRGEHPAFGTANHTIMLDGNYLELLTVERVTPASAARAEILGHREGAYAVALATEDCFAVHRALAEHGFAVDAPADFVRPVRLHDGAHDARFRIVQLPPAPRLPNLFACQHFTRDLVWRPEWMAHPNGALRVSEIILSHADPAALATDYAGVFGREAIETNAQGWRLMLGNVCLTVASPAALAERFAGAVLPDERDAWFAGAAIAVRSLAVVVALLQSHGIAYVTLAEGIVVPPAAANGALLLFQE
jgi:catechol 2,3-dioxygenase-like lactoylglutathione lyase family enzyme